MIGSQKDKNIKPFCRIARSPSHFPPFGTPSALVGKKWVSFWKNLFNYSIFLEECNRKSEGNRTTGKKSLYSGPMVRI
jgi:hypothetical protein